MTTLFLDLIQDLREKRLWPVAVALLAATAAVPLVLLKPAHSGSTGPAQTASNSSAEGLPVLNVDKSGAKQSKLDQYSTKNPFKPVGKLSGGPGGSTPLPSAAGGAASAAGSGGGAGGSGGSGGSAGGGPGVPSTGGTPSGGGPRTTKTTQAFALHIDVKFGPRGHVKTYEDVKQLEMLPSETNPVAVFMGMTSDFKTAIFLIDTSKYEADGEGKCKPSATNCAFVKLNLHDSGNEETLASTDGNSEYTLELTGIHRVPIGSAETKTVTPSKRSASSPKAKARAKAAVATGGKAHGHDAPNPLSQLFELPSFAVRG